MRVTRNHGEEVSTLVRLASRQAERSQSASMEAADEREKRMLPRMPLCKLHRSLNRLRPAIAEKHFLPKIPRSNLHKFLRNIHNLLAIEISPRVVNELLSLFLDR